MRRVVFVLLPGVHALDLAGPLQVFDAANELGAGYETVFAACTPEVRGAQGLVYAALSPLPEVGAQDLVIVPGVRVWEIGASEPPARAGPYLNAELRSWLRGAYAAGARLASVCSGALALAEAGLLAGRRCTTHWLLLDLLRGQYPDARVQDGVLFVRDGRIITSAGIASGIDMALSLLEEAHGPLFTAQVARGLVVYLRRDGTHAQSSVYLEYRTHLHRGVHRVQDYLCANPAERVRLAQLARLANMSERGLARAFKDATGLTPLQYQQRLRLEVARNLLHDPNLTVESVAHRCGFEDARHFRRLWVRAFGEGPSRRAFERSPRA